MNSEYVNGWLCLTPYGETLYVLPKHDQKWGDWMVHPNPTEKDSSFYGVGRYYINKKPTFDHATGTTGRWLWFVRVRKSSVLGESDEKFSATEIQLRRVSFKAFARMIRLGWMKGANLGFVNLNSADLRDADLRGANLYGAYLRGTNLYGADLSRADLDNADLRVANLSYANLLDTTSQNADFWGANLHGAIGYKG